jgi:hypothetical protein
MMRYMVFLISIIITVSGCQVNSGGRQSRDGVMTSLTCQQVSAQLNNSITCIPTDTGLLLQTINQQVTLDTQTAKISFDSTIFWSYAGIEMFFLVLDGVGSFSTSDETRLLRAGYAVTIDSSETLMTVGKPVEPFIPSRDVLVNLPVNNLPRPVERLTVQATDMPIQATSAPVVQWTVTPDTTILSAPISTSVSIMTHQPNDEMDNNCAIPFDWGRLHLVQAGDTLTRIAMEYDVDILDLIAGNCIENPDRLSLNQEIYLPSSGTAGTTSIPPPVTNMTTSPDVQFTAERDVILAGDCVTLTWVANASSTVNLGGAMMPTSGNQAVCPVQTITYDLIVTDVNGIQSTYSQTITVTE